MKNKKIEIKSILFDLDGTIIDTESTAAQAIEACFQEWGLKIEPTDASYITGRTWESAFLFLHKKYQFPVPKEVAEEKIIHRYRTLLDQELRVVPGSVEAVRALSSHFQLALVSGSRREEILWALKKLKIDSCFSIILGAEDYPRSKPSPDGYLKALQLLNAESSSSLVFEDSTAGIQSALAAHLWVVAITTTNYFKQDQSQAHFSIPDLSPVHPDWVRNLSFPSF